MHVEHLREARPENIDRELVQKAVENVHSVDSLHLLFAIFIYLYHYKDRVQVEDAPLTVLLKFVRVEFQKDVSEYLVEHVCLLGLISNLKIKELKDENHFLGHRIGHQFKLTTECLLNKILLLLLNGQIGDDWIIDEHWHTLGQVFLISCLLGLLVGLRFLWIFFVVLETAFNDCLFDPRG